MESSALEGRVTGLTGIALTGSGSAVPEQVVDNEALAQVVETSDEWIATRTGIRQRRILPPGSTLADLAATAGDRALQSAGLAAQDLDFIVLATSTPDDLFGTAAQVQAKLGATNAVAFDLTAACSGFLFGLVTAAQFIRTGVYRNVLIIGADALSRWVDWTDRRTCILFGDGAGAVVMQQNEVDHLLGFEMRSDGQLNSHLNLAHQGEARSVVSTIDCGQGNYTPVTMNGQEVYRFAVTRVPEVLEKALFRANLAATAVDWLVMHQANQRILDAAANRLKIPAEKVLSNLGQYGNTSAASIPLVLDEAVRQGRVKAGDVLAMAGFGAGLSWGGAIVKWGR